MKDEYVKGFNDAIDRVLMLMHINPWYADEKIMDGYGHCLEQKSKAIASMRILPQGIKQKEK